jgi:hypothetical protein
LFYGSRKPSKPEQFLYGIIQAVFPGETVSLEHYVPGSKKSIDALLLSRKIAFQADGYDHVKIKQSDAEYDQWLFQTGFSVVRLYCRDTNVWGAIAEAAKGLSNDQRSFILYSPWYDARQPPALGEARSG